MTHAILVTGGAGYVGSHTCLELAKEGYLPITIDNLSTGFAHNVKWGPLVEGDVHDNKLIVKIIKLYNIQAVIHFAGSAYVGESVKVPRKYYENNTVGTLSLLNSLLETGLTNIVFSSTCSVYGLADDCPITEETPLNPINPYGESKINTENFLIENKHRFNSIILRYFNVAGADPDLRSGLISDEPTHLIKILSEVAVGKREKIFIYGNDYNTDDGTAIRDYIHVCDLADIHLEVAKYLLDKKHSNIFNCGYGKGYSVLEVINAANKITNNKIKFEYTKRRPGDAEKLVSNIDKLNKNINWQPKFDNLDFIIQTSINWEKKYEKDL